MLQFLKRYTKRTDGKRWTKKTILKRMAEECNVTPVNKKYDVWPLNEELDLYCELYPYRFAGPNELMLVSGFVTPKNPKSGWVDAHMKQRQ